jgi:hypothetical protein
MRIKVFLITIFMLFSVGYLFYSMDFNIEEKKDIQKDISSQKDLEVKKTEVKKTEEKKDNKINGQKIEKEEPAKIIETVKNVKDKIVKNLSENNESTLNRVFARNYFKRERKIDVKEIIEPENKVTIEELLSDTLNSIRLYFIMQSDYDNVAIINNNKVRKGDVISINNTEVEIITIDMESIVVGIGTNEVKIDMKR